MAESIILHFATADEATVAKLLLASGCSQPDARRWQYPEKGTPRLFLAPYTDLDSEYAEDDKTSHLHSSR